jgi:hypothetical protein
MLAEQAGHKRVIHIRSRREIERFLRGLEPQRAVGVAG